MIKTEKINENIDWVQVIDCRPVDKNTLKLKYHLTPEMLYYVLDRHERPRVEYYEDENVLLFIYDVAEHARFSGDVTAEPIGIISRGGTLFTFTAGKNNFVNDLIKKIVSKQPKAKLDTMQPMDLILMTLYQLSIQYFDYINQINTVRTRIQKNMRGKARKSSISKMLNLQTNLVYFLTSLSSNDDMLNDFKRRFTKGLSEDQMDAVEDVIIEIQQGLSMAKIANEATQQVANAYSNLLDSNLNNTMKFLTVFTLILSVPNIIFGFYGQNVKLPMSTESWSWIGTVILTLAFIGIVLFILWMNDFFKR